MDIVVIGLMLVVVVIVVLITIEVLKFFRETPSDPPFVSPDQMDDEDPFMREIIVKAWNTGKPVVGNRDSDGTTSIKVIGENEEEDNR